jgi:hypothetical protein
LGSREVAQIGGPALGGLLARAVGPVTGLLADAVSFTVSFCCLTAIGAKYRHLWCTIMEQPPAPTADRRPPAGTGIPCAARIYECCRDLWCFAVSG